ncbi:hypothetical protein [Brevibacillus agri]|uniref:hypothetical protein n=1 Tax=Brevibacillus agri TaxID=51101 RepID=UPI001EE5CD32|nr:hypothetical protein [Brevibacillus agri]MCG5252582.1 hypothetical protein [Brevibacillus agri]
MSETRKIRKERDVTMAQRNRRRGRRPERKPPQFKLYQVFRVDGIPEGPLGDRLMAWLLRDYA